MKNFWESSPEWQRKEEAFAACEAAEKAKIEAGKEVLACILSYGPEMSNRENEARIAYLEAYEDLFRACSKYSRAESAFDASPVGAARKAYFADVIVRETTKEAA